MKKSAPRLGRKMEPPAALPAPPPPSSPQPRPAGKLPAVDLEVEDPAMARAFARAEKIVAALGPDTPWLRTDFGRPGAVCQAGIRRQAAWVIAGFGDTWDEALDDLARKVAAAAAKIAAAAAAKTATAKAIAAAKAPKAP